MSTNWGPPAHNFVPEYQQSSIPFVTSSAAAEVDSTTPVRITFPYVTRWIVVHNLNKTAAHHLRLGFTSNGVLGVGGRHYFEIAGGEYTERLEVKCREIWFLADNSSHPVGFSLFAGLTNVPSGSFPIISGSEGIAGVG